MPFKNTADGGSRQTSGNPIQNWLQGLHSSIWETYIDVVSSPFVSALTGDYYSRSDKDRFLYLMDEVIGLGDDRQYYSEENKGSMPGGTGGPSWATEMIENYNPNYGEQPITGQSNAYDEWYKNSGGG